MKAIIYLFVVVSAGALASCKKGGKSEESQTEPISKPSDPVGDLEKLIAHIPQEKQLTAFTMENVKYDVIRTESLVSPILGTIEFDWVGATARHCVLTLAYQDGKWAMKKLVAETVDGPARELAVGESPWHLVAAKLGLN